MMRGVIVLSILCLATTASAQIKPGDSEAEHAFRGPTPPQSAVDGSFGDAGTFGPRGDAQRFAANGQEHVVAPIAALLFFCRPPDVSRLVVSVHVDSVDAVEWARSGADVGQERREIVKPFRADGDSASSVSDVFTTRNGRTSAPHVFPRRVFRRGDASVRRVDDGVSGPDEFFTETTAGTGVTGQQTGGSDYLFGTAVASHRSVPMAALDERQGDYDQPSESIVNADILIAHGPPLRSVKWPGGAVNSSRAANHSTREIPC